MNNDEELYELKMTLENYERILLEDSKIKETDTVANYLLLNDEDINKIKTKMELIKIKIKEMEKK